MQDLPGNGPAGLNQTMVHKKNTKTAARHFASPPQQQLRVFAPASVANVACGYDVLGFAVEEPGDEVTVKAIGKAGLTITKIEGDGGALSLDPKQNSITAPVLKYLEDIQYGAGFEFELIKNVPFSGGMGSSAASSVAGVYAVNELLGKPLSSRELLPFAMEGERIACGTAHADNVAAALLGGFVIVRSYSPLDVVQIDYPTRLHCALVHPEVTIQTRDSREALPEKVYLKDAVSQWGNVAGLIAGLTKGDFDLISRSLEDHLIEPVRSAFIPSYEAVKTAALQAGSLGCNISGSGPSVFALTTSKRTAEKCAAAMQAVFEGLGIESQTHVSRINNRGPRVIA